MPRPGLEPRTFDINVAYFDLTAPYFDLNVFHLIANKVMCAK